MLNDCPAHYACITVACTLVDCVQINDNDDDDDDDGDDDAGNNFVTVQHYKGDELLQ